MSRQRMDLGSGGLENGPRYIPDTEPAPAQTVKPRKGAVRRVFQDLLEQVDEGTISSDQLKSGSFPDGISIATLSEVYRSSADDRNLLHFAIEDKPDTEQELKNRVVLVKCLLKSCPELFDQYNAEGEDPLYYTISRYNRVGRSDKSELKSYDVCRKFAVLFLSEPSLTERCHIFLNKTDNVRFNLHTAVKEMGVDLIPYLGRVDQETLKRKDLSGNTPLHLAVEVQHWRTDENPGKRVQLVTELIRLCEDALMIKNGSKDHNATMRKSPYRYHQSLCQVHHGGSEATCENKTCQEIEFTLKDAYMHLNLPDRENVSDYLYNGNQGLYFHLDLSELTDMKPPPCNFLVDLEVTLRHMNLDTILRYIWLPKNPLLTEQPIDPNKYMNYSVVFEWLRKKKVRTIIYLKVEDNEQLPHSDETIVDMLKGIDIEIWDWIQYDLCCDTIAQSAPNVKEVYLYSTGNKAVLQNWSSEDGLIKLKHLQKINIQMRVRPTSGKVTIDYEDFLKSRLKDSGVTAELCVNSDDSRASKYNGSSNHTSLHDRSGGVIETGSWFRCIDRFATFINGISEDAEKGAGSPVVKIAIIDDGVNTHEQRFRASDIMDGTSFYTRGALGHGSEIKSSNHFPSSSGHGTEMADRIRQVFPKAKLYIARLDITRGEAGDITITARSAAEAIKWAVMKKVDIISMSWTVEKTPHNRLDLQTMEEAIEAAHKENILMFCTAKDGGYGQSGFGYPKEFKKPVFCIGATTEHGNLSESIGNQREAIDFGLPGENLTPLSDSKELKITGSSIATALASGLAGLLLYCVQFSQDGSQRRKDLQTYDVMKRTLSKMADNAQKYISVSNNLDLGKDDCWDEDGKASFYKIVDKICGYMDTGSAL